MADGCAYRPTVAVLFARRSSVYKSDPRCDVFDIDRDALTFSGGLPVVAHPPCRSWGRLKHLAKPRDGERELAFFAVEQVRRCGGVLEHPAGSSLFAAASLPVPGTGMRDEFGGYVFPVSQKWWGHRAEKRTMLYVVGVEPADVPVIPLSLADPIRPVEFMGVAERERTPEPFARWLVDLASRVGAMRGVSHG